MKPRLLDLFCGAGGAGMGYSRAGFEVVGVDIKPQPHYPFAFVQMDAFDAMRVLLSGGYITDNRGHKWYLSDFDAIHASPPCQAYSSITRDHSRHPDLYALTRAALIASGKPFIIENVIGAPYDYGIVLCGSMFGMQIQRHRNFETSWLMFQPQCRHEVFNGRPYTITGRGKLTREWISEHSRQPPEKDGPALMHMPWATWSEIVLAIPPDYTEFIGAQLLRVLT